MTDYGEFIYGKIPGISLKSIYLSYTRWILYWSGGQGFKSFYIHYSEIQSGPFGWLINTSGCIKDAGNAADRWWWGWVVQATLHLLPTEEERGGEQGDRKMPGPSSGVFSFDPWTENSKKVTSRSHLTSLPLWRTRCSPLHTHTQNSSVHYVVIMQRKRWRVGQGSPCSVIAFHWLFKTSVEMNVSFREQM